MNLNFGRDDLWVRGSTLCIDGRTLRFVVTMFPFLKVRVEFTFDHEEQKSRYLNRNVSLPYLDFGFVSP